MFYLSENLKKYRIMKNLTQEDVAEYLGLTPQSISKWERGECYSTRNPLSPRLARGFSLISAYQKATTKNVVANFILPLILQTLSVCSFFYL